MILRGKKMAAQSSALMSGEKKIIEKLGFWEFYGFSVIFQKLFEKSQFYPAGLIRLFFKWLRLVCQLSRK